MREFCVNSAGAPPAPEHAASVSSLTGESIGIETYSGAAHAIRRWFALTGERGGIETPPHTIRKIAPFRQG